MRIENIVKIWIIRFLLCVSISLMLSAKGWGQPIPTATISGAATVCQDAFPPNITFTGADGTPPYTFNYTINNVPFQSSPTTSGNSVTVSVPTSTAGTFTYSLISVIDASLIPNAQSGFAVVTVNPLPVPTITGPAAACLNSTGNIYTTEPGMSSYSWSLTGGTISAGSLTNAITVTWNTLGAQSVSVNYNNANNCPAASPTVYAVTIDPLPVPTFTVQPGANTCVGASVTYTTQTGGGITNYVWTVSGVSGTDYTITAGGTGNASSTVTLQWLTTGIKTVTVNYSSASGCPGASAANNSTTVDLLPVPTFTVQPGANTCVGASVTYTTQTGAGITNYVWTVSGVSGTDYTITAGGTGNASNTVTLQWLTTGVKTVTVNYSNTSGCTDASAASNSTTVNALPVPTLTSSDADNTFCQGTSVTFTAGGGTIFNFRVGAVSKQNGSSSTYTTSTLIEGDVVSVIVTNANGCSAPSAGITNTVHPLPIPTITSSAVGNISCQGASVTFTASGGSNYNFRVAGSSVKNSASATYTTSSLTNGQVVDVIVTNSNGCVATSAGITNTVNPQPIANAGTGGNVCGLGFHLDGTMNTGTGTGTWAKISGPGNVSFSPNASTTNALVTVTAFGTYTFNWTVINGTCSNSANVSVTFIQEIPASGGSGGDVCGKSLALNAMVPVNGTGTWSKSIGPGNAIFTPDIHQSGAKVTVDQFGVYDFAWTVISGTCSSSDIIRVVFHDLPLINAGRDTAMCKGGSVQLKAAGTGSVSWTPVQLLSNPNIINPIATPDTTTKFTVNLTDQFGCKNSDTIIVEVRNIVVADAETDQVLYSVFTTQLDAKLAHTYENGVWSIVSGTGQFKDSTDSRTVVDGLSLGINKLLWTVTNGFCSPASDSTNINVKEFVMSTMITPNMDGRNDYFVIGGLTSQSKTELLIFDRRGVQVYKNLNYDNSWNGVDYNNNPLPDDTYFYVLKYADGKSYRGYIVIRR
jgi:gliding motility-associated-like protein